MKNFEIEIAEILEVNSISLEEKLKSFDCWDSLTVLSIIALANENYDVSISASEIYNSITIGDLKNLIQSRLK